MKEALEVEAALRLALEALERIAYFKLQPDTIQNLTDHYITAIKEALMSVPDGAQPERIYTKNDLRAEYKRGLRDGGETQYAPNW